MSVRWGMSILDLLPLTTGIASAVPDGILEQIAVLNIVDHRSTSSPGFYLHEGTLQSIADQFDLNTANWALSIPGVATGLPFRVAVARAPLFPATSAPLTIANPPDFNQEDIPLVWSIDIEVNPIVVVIPGLNAATLVDGDPMKTPTLQAVIGSAAQRRVTVQASCVLRISGGGPAGTLVQLMDTPDPLDPNAPSGATIRADMRPNTSVFGNSQYGMKLDTLVVDLSRQFTPADIEARGHDEVWTGMSLKELTFFLPIKTPMVDSLTVGGRDLIVGNPFGMQGELSADFSKDFPDTLNDFVTIEQYVDKNSAPLEIEAVTPPLQVNPPMFEYPVPTDANAQTRRVRAVFDLGQPLGGGIADTKVIGVWWEIPGGTEGNSAETPWFDAPTDAVLRYRLRIVDATLVGQPAAQPGLPSAVPSAQTEMQEVTASFPRQQGSPSGVPPLVDAKVGAGPLYFNTLHLRGPRHLLTTVAFETRAQAIDVRWQLGAGSAPVIARSAKTFSLAALPAGNGPFELIVTDNNGDPNDTKGVRRIRIDVVAAGPLAIGHQETSAANAKGMVKLDFNGAILQPTAVSDTFLAREYHATGARQSAPVAASLSGPRVTTAIGTDAEVEVAIPTGANQPAPAVQQTTTIARAVQILYEYGQATPISVKNEDNVVTVVPSGQSVLKHQDLALPMAINFMGRSSWPGADLGQQLAAWVADLEQKAPGADRHFYVVGRTDDLWYGVDKNDNRAENDKLAEQRMLRAVGALEKVVDPARIKARIETGPAPAWPGVAQGAPPRMVAVGRLALPAGAAPDTQPYVQKGPLGRPVWRHDWSADATDNVLAGQHAVAKADLDRAGYRCAEIFAIDTNQQQPAPPPALGGKASLVKMLVPGQDGPITKKVVATSKGANTDFRIRVKVRWDSPFASGAADYIPSLAEAMIRWKPSNDDVLKVGANPPPAVASTVPSGADFWEVMLNWAYDAGTGQTEATGALSLPHGKLQLISDVWASSFAFAPALAAKLDDSDVMNTEAGEFFGGVACIVAGALIGAFINKNASAGAGDHHGSVIFDKFTICYKWNGAPHVSATTDYTVDLRIDTGIPGAFSVIGNLKMAYKGVGLRFDGAGGAAGGGISDISLCMKDLSVQVVDPGTWSLGGPLGDLIRIAATRMGNGSDWMEFDLEFAIDLGVVFLEGAVIRMNFAGDPQKSAVELRGLTARIEVPETLKGKGSASIGEGGAFRALLGLEVIPAKLSAYGAIAVDKDFVAIEVGIQLPVGIPLGGTGFGLFGFMGRFVANGSRDLTKCAHPDPVEKQLKWYALQPDWKYTRRSGQYAFGVGAVIGTLPDGGFSFNAEGALTVGFPDISVVFSIDAQLIAQRKSQASSQGSANNSSARILGMVVMEPKAIMLAVRTTYTIPKILELKIPISAYFPLADGTKGWYIRIGTDGALGREGSPISLTLFPTILDVKAWAFVMFEEKGMQNLGGIYIPYWAKVPPLNFDGFSIGVGAGFDLSWEAGPFSLSISAFLVLGLGTKPLLCAGAAGVAGSLDLVIVTLDVNGWLYFHIGEQASPYAEGHFCASIDCLLFTIDGCVDIEIGSPWPDDIPKPASPISGIDLVDHFAIVKGKAAAGGAAAVPVVWPDTIGVVKFAHYIDDQADSPTGFVRKLVSPAALSPWSGSNQLKYAYRLTKIELQKLDGGQWGTVDGPFDSAWWLPTHRAAVIEPAAVGIPPSTEEGRELGLWTIDPAPWARWLTADSLNVPGNPANTIGKLCDPAGVAAPSCAYGRDRIWAYAAFGAFDAQANAGVAYPSRFLTVASLDSAKGLSELVALGAGAGCNYVPGKVTGLGLVFDHAGVKLDQGWRFPAFRKQALMVGTVPMRLAPSRALLEGELYLQVCTETRTSLPPVKRVCDTMPARDGTIDSFTGASGAVYQGKLACLAIAGERALHLSAPLAGVHAAGAVDEVAVLLDPGKDAVLLTAFDANDLILGRVKTAAPGRQWLSLTLPGIVKIRVEPTMGLVPVTLFVVCWGRSDQPVDGTGRICDTMPAQDGRVGGFTGASGAVYEGTMSALAVNGERALTLGGRLFGVHRAAAVAGVSVELDPGTGWASLSALDANGLMLGRVQTSVAARQWLRLDFPGIVQIIVEPDPRTRPVVTLFTVCWGAQGPSRPVTIHDLVEIEQLPTPLVRAVDELGLVTVLTGVPAGPAPDRRQPCAILVYKLPRNKNGKAWVRIEVAPWYKGNLSLVALCGVTMEAYTAQQDDDKFKTSLVKLLEGQSDDVENDTPTQHTYLEAASSYKLKLSWEYQGWHATNPGENPPLAANQPWKTGGTDEFRFDTAPFGLVDPNLLPSSQTTTLDMDPAQGGPGFDERSFDPRGVARYIAHAQPTHEDPPHFLDDQIGFWFMVNHLQSLVAKYDGRALQVKVYHTRPPAGSLHGYTFHTQGSRHVLDVTLDDPAVANCKPPVWEMTTDAWTEIDLNVDTVIQKLPCVDAIPGSGGSKVTVFADLLPNSEYDLLLNVVKPDDSKVKEVVVARSHFRTSRYRNPAEMLLALGFAPAASGATPNDFITGFDLQTKYGPQAKLQVGDGAFDQAMKLCGMDPWPLPAAPRTTVIWRATNDAAHPWQIVGVLLEADEPIWRAGMRTGALNQPDPQPRLEVKSLEVYRTYERELFINNRWTIKTEHELVGAGLREVVRNAAGTRMLFGAGAAPIALDRTSRLFDIALRFSENGVAGVSGAAAIFNRPDIIAQEL